VEYTGYSVFTASRMKVYIQGDVRPAYLDTSFGSNTPIVFLCGDSAITSANGAPFVYNVQWFYIDNGERIWTEGTYSVGNSYCPGLLNTAYRSVLD